MKKQITLAVIILTSFFSTVAAQNWQAIRLPLEDNITGITFLNPDTGFLVTSRGWFARTEDGAKTWKKHLVAFNTRLEDVSFINSSEGLACGLRGALYRTTDGGRTWANVSPGDSVQMFYDVELFDAKTGLVIGMDRGSEVPYAGIAYRTTDGGKTWKKQKRLGLGYSEIFYRPGGDVYFLSFGQLHRSKDKGKTWQTIKAAPENRARSLSFFGKSGLMAGLEGMCGISSDSGKTWTTVKLDKDLTFVKAELVNEKEGYIAGLNDKLFATTDGGKTWNPELPAKLFTILDMYKIGDRLYAVGTDGGMMYKVVK